MHEALHTQLRVVKTCKSLLLFEFDRAKKKHGPDLRVQACRTTREVH